MLVWTSTSAKRRRPSSQRTFFCSYPCFGSNADILLVGMHKVKSVIDGTEQCWTSRTKVKQCTEFIELRASKLGVASVVRADFEICIGFVKMTRSPKGSHLG